MSRIVIVTALVPEARALARAFHLDKARSVVPMWAGDAVVVACVGVRASRINLLQEFIKSEEPSLLVMAGVAGALSPALRVGDVVVETSSNSEPTLDRVFFGRVHTADGIVATPALKAQLFAATRCLAVDMETEHVREFAAAAGTPLVAVRGISDTAADPLDEELLSLIDVNGRPRIGRAVAMLGLKPWKIGMMLRMQRATGCAMASIARVLAHIVASGWPVATINPRSTT